MTGFEIAEAIGLLKRRTEIVFVSNLEHLVYDSLKFRPFRFVRKSLLSDDIRSALDSFFIEQKRTHCFYSIHRFSAVCLFTLLFVQVLLIHLNYHCPYCNGRLFDVVCYPSKNRKQQQLCYKDKMLEMSQTNITLNKEQEIDRLLKHCHTLLFYIFINTAIKYLYPTFVFRISPPRLRRGKRYIF